MGARRDFRDDTAEICMQGGLTENDRGQDLCIARAPAHNGGGGVVATAFQTKKGQRVGHAASGCLGVCRR